MSLRIDLRPSRILNFVQQGQLLLACLATMLLASDSLLALLLLLPIGVYAHSLRKRPFTPNALVLMSDEWFLMCNEHVIPATLKDQFHCSTWLQILEFKLQHDATPGHARLTLVILPDSASSASRRQLRTMLRWYHFPCAAAAESQLDVSGS